MASSTADQQAFRFLDLPVELRSWAYERMIFSTSWHTLYRVDARFDDLT